MGVELEVGQPTKSSCQSLRYFSRSFAFAYSQYAFSRSQTCASSPSLLSANTAVVSTSRHAKFRNMARACYPVSAAGATPDGNSSDSVAIFERANVDLHVPLRSKNYVGRRSYIETQ